jgi:hypothetical protein
VWLLKPLSGFFAFAAHIGSLEGVVLVAGALKGQ